MYENVHTSEGAYSSTAILDLLLNTSAKKKRIRKRWVVGGWGINEPECQNLKNTELFCMFPSPSVIL